MEWLQPSLRQPEPLTDSVVEPTRIRYGSLGQARAAHRLRRIPEPDVGRLRVPVGVQLHARQTVAVTTRKPTLQAEILAVYGGVAEIRVDWSNVIAGA